MQPNSARPLLEASAGLRPADGGAFERRSVASGVHPRLRQDRSQHGRPRAPPAGARMRDVEPLARWRHRVWILHASRSHCIALIHANGPLAGATGAAACLAGISLVDTVHEATPDALQGYARRLIALIPADYVVQPATWPDPSGFLAAAASAAVGSRRACPRPETRLASCTRRSERGWVHAPTPLTGPVRVGADVRPYVRGQSRTDRYRGGADGQKTLTSCLAGSA